MNPSVVTPSPDSAASPYDEPIGASPARAQRTRPSPAVTNTAIRTGNPGLMSFIGRLVLPVMAPLMSFMATLLWQRDFWEAYVVVGLMAFFILYPGRWASNRKQINVSAQVLTPWSLAVATLLAIGLVSGYLQYFSYRVLATWIVLTPIAQTLALYAMPSIFGRLVAMRRPRHQVVIVGDTELGQAFAATVHHDAAAHSEVIGFFDDRREDRLSHPSVAPLLGKVGDLPAYARNHRVDQIYITLPLASHPRITTLLDGLRDSTASIYFLPDLHHIDLIQPRMDTHVGFAVVGVCESPFQGLNALVKTASDYVLASLAIVLLSPVMLAVALAIRLTSPGPVIFRQRRFGVDGSEISVWKFRSMTVTEDGDRDYRQVSRDDARLTRIGAFLRRTSLDELPQFFNVLQGKMSIVGPRPHALRVNEQYRSLIPGYMVRHKVRPGITGWAQVHGYRGGDDLASMTKRVEYDLAYLRDWSLWMDLRIILRTAGLVMRDSSAY
ncbi:MAG: undecaprenyl-phosphate glucose phosphotransferase [Burkholderiaceae bacterium]